MAVTVAVVVVVGHRKALEKPKIRALLSVIFEKIVPFYTSLGQAQTAVSRYCAHQCASYVKR
jgi:hypothetical protein